MPAIRGSVVRREESRGLTINVHGRLAQIVCQGASPCFIQAKDDGGVNLEAGMSLYGLKHFELVSERTVVWPLTGTCTPGLRVLMSARCAGAIGMQAPLA